MPRKFLFPLIFILLTAYAHGQEKNFRNEFGFKSENDAYLAYGQDRYYTNGLFVTFRHAFPSSNPEKVRKKIWEAELGQYMFNPFTGRITNTSSIDRPFAAYLYGAGKLSWFFRKERLLRATLQVGTIGPAAKGREVQEMMHQTAGFYEIKGWQYQLNNELGLNMGFHYSSLIKRSASKHSDINFSGYLKAGNTFSGAGAGLLLRSGKINPLHRSASTDSRISFPSSSDSTVDKELFLFAKPVLHLVAYDATVQGGLFQDDKGPVTYQPRPLVFSQEIGVRYATNRWSLNFSVIFKSKEVKSRAKAHQYGSASIYYRFN